MGKLNKGGNALTPEEFVIKAIREGRGKYAGLHSVYSGFNEAFRMKFGKDSNPVAVTTKMAQQGKIVTRPVRGGVMLYIAGEEPKTKTAGQTLLAKIDAS